MLTHLDSANFVFTFVSSKQRDWTKNCVSSERFP